jgi:hypothetical protein
MRGMRREWEGLGMEEWSRVRNVIAKMIESE